MRNYLRIALGCIDPIIDENLSGAALARRRFIPVVDGATQRETSPLLRYRAAICKLDARPELEAVRASEPRFVEASLSPQSNPSADPACKSLSATALTFDAGTGGRQIVPDNLWWGCAPEPSAFTVLQHAPSPPRPLATSLD